VLDVVAKSLVELAGVEDPCAAATLFTRIEQLAADGQ